MKEARVEDQGIDLQEVWIGTWRALTQWAGGPIETEGEMSVFAGFGICSLALAEDRNPQQNVKNFLER